MAQTRYSKTLIGRNTTVIVAGQCAITAAATPYADFVNNASAGLLPDGTIGIFNEATNLSVAIGAPLAANTKFFVAQALSNTKGGWNVKKTGTYLYNASEISIAQQIYVAPVKPVAYIGFNGTSGSLNLGTITPNYTYLAAINDTSPANQPIPSYVFDEVAKTGSDAYSLLVNTSGGIVNKINDYGTGKTSWANLQKNPKTYIADVVSNGTYAAATPASPTFVTGSASVTAAANTYAVGDFVRIGANAGTTVVYRVVSQTAGAFVLDRPYTGTSGAVTAFKLSTVPTEFGIKITTTVFDSTFRLSVSQYLENAIITYATDWKVGSGRADMVKELEDAGAIFQGVTTGNTTFVDDWGRPSSLVGYNRGYKTYSIVATKSELSVAKPVSEWVHRSYCIIVAPHDGTEVLVSPAPGITAAAASPIVALTAILAAI